MQIQAVNLGLRVSMSNPPNRLFCRLDGLTPTVREQKRVSLLKNLGLLETESIPVFDEATQTAANFLATPICTLGIMVYDQLWLKSAVGLSRLGLMNKLASGRKIPRSEAFCTYVVDSHQRLIIYDTFSDPIFADSTLAQHYGIRSYLGSPLITSDGWCLGTLAVMDSQPRQFTEQDLEILTLTARWCLREFERDYLLQNQANQSHEWLMLNQSSNHQKTNERVYHDEQQTIKTNISNSISGVKLKLLKQLTQELRAPLTSVIGMASVLLGEVFGKLSSKQKEYLDIIYNSGQQMNSIVDEILRLGASDENLISMKLKPVNIEMLCQQVINDLSKVSPGNHQEIRLSVEPGKRIWLLDKDKIQQAIYYLIVSVLSSSEAGGEIRLHVSRKNKTLNLSVWLSNPWLADGLPQVKLPVVSLNKSLLIDLESPLSSHSSLGSLDRQLDHQVLSANSLEAALNGIQDLSLLSSENNPQQLLGLLLACHLTESHGGKIVIQGTPESGHRYVMMLPKVAAGNDHL